MAPNENWTAARRISAKAIPNRVENLANRLDALNSPRAQKEEKHPVFGETAHMVIEQKRSINFGAKKNKRINPRTCWYAKGAFPNMGNIVRTPPKLTRKKRVLHASANNNGRGKYECFERRINALN